MRCSTCHREGHNARSCNHKPAAPTRNYVKLAAPLTRPGRADDLFFFFNADDKSAATQALYLAAEARDGSSGHRDGSLSTFHPSPFLGLPTVGIGVES